MRRAYLVDRKLVTYLMASIKSLPFEQLKDNIISKIEAAISVDQIQCIINETVYFNDVAKRFEESERERSEL
jgi:hypothetical protein